MEHRRHVVAANKYFVAASCSTSLLFFLFAEQALVNLQVNSVVQVGKAVDRKISKNYLGSLVVNMVKMALSYVHSISVARSKTWYPLFTLWLRP